MKWLRRLPTCRAFTFVGLLIIIAILAILAAMLLPALARAKAKARSIQCVNNLKQDALAFRLWAGDHDGQFPMSVSTNKGGTLEWVEGGNAFRHFQVMSNELNTPKILVCPNDTREAALNFAHLRNRNLSYFVGLDGSDTRPKMFLAGDRNITNGLGPGHAILTLLPGQPAGWTETIHVKQGNIALAEGSVSLLTTPALRDALRQTGNATNRIALPE